MPRLPRIRTGSNDLDIALEQWKGIIDPALPNSAEPLLVPRNARTSQPAPSTIRVRWDPGGIHAEGHDVAYSETADFLQSQSHRVSGLQALYFDLVVQDARKRYFRVRSYRGDEVTRWSNIVAGTANLNTGDLPASGLTFSPVLRNEFGFIGIEDIQVGGGLPADLTGLHTSYACVDEASAQANYVIFGAMDATTDPVTVPVSIIGDPDHFRVGCLIVIDDPSADLVKVGRRAYEIFNFRQDDGMGNWILDRAQLDSTMLEHSNGLKGYRVDEVPEDPSMSRNLFRSAPPATTSGVQEPRWTLIPGSAVVAVAAQLHNAAGPGPVAIVNCASLAYPLPITEHTDNPGPGFRTLGHEEFVLPLFGTLTRGQSMTNRVLVAESFSLGGALCTLRLAAVGEALFSGLFAGVTCAVGGYLIYIEPPRQNLPHGERRVAVLEQFAVPEEAPDSQRPDSFLYQRRVPYNGLWPFRGIVVGLLGELWDLTTGLFITDNFPLVAQGEMAIEGGGELDLLIEQVGSETAGSDLTAFV